MIARQHGKRKRQNTRLANMMMEKGSMGPLGEVSKLLRQGQARQGRNRNKRPVVGRSRLAGWQGEGEEENEKGLDHDGTDALSSTQQQAGRPA